jgi:hypothetical protein
MALRITVDDVPVWVISARTNRDVRFTPESGQSRSRRPLAMNFTGAMALGVPRQAFHELLRNALRKFNARHRA